MKSILTLIFTLLLSISLSAQQKIEQETIDRSRAEPSLADKRLTPKIPYTGKYSSAFSASRGGGSTDCFSFVPVPDDAIELDFTSNNCAGSGGLDAAHGPFSLDFDFCHFGDLFNEIVISNKGNIQFGGSCDFSFVPAGFPNNGLPMVAAFWADIDMSCDDCGSLFYWLTPTAAYFTWVEVGYWPDVSTLKNTFQIVITDGTDPVVGIGNNVGLFYQDMQWTSSNWNGGAAGFNGDAATVGANQGDGQNFVQFGRFISDTDEYDGPFGVDDGVHWLDDKAFVFNICSTTDNLPPISNVTDNCDTIFICQNDSFEFDVSFNPPEGDQIVTVTVDDSDAIGWTETGSGDGFMTGIMEGNASNVGSHTLVFTATDDGEPVASTSTTYVIEVIDIEIPDLVVTGTGFENDIITFCGGTDGAELMASDGFDFYDWGLGITSQEAVLPGAGEYTLSASLSGCEANYGPITVLETPFFNPGVSSPGLTVCSGQTTTIIADDFLDYQTVEWSVFSTGEILTADLSAEEIEVTEGVYELNVIDENGCPGSRFVPIGLIQIQEGTIPTLDCGDKEICWSGAWAAPDPCQHFIYLSDSEGDTWEGANVEVFLDGLGPLNFNINNAATFLPSGIEATQGQVIEYFFTSGLDDDDINVEIFNCENEIIFSTMDGDELVDDNTPFFTQIAQTPLQALNGTWTTSNTNGEFSATDSFNPAEGTACYTVPDDYIGTDIITFSADICPLELEYELLFSQPVEITLDQTDFELCAGDGGAFIQPSFFPPTTIDPIQYTWDPNIIGCDGSPECLIENSVAWSLEAENSCSNEDQVSGFVIINPTPVANLQDMSICGGGSIVLNPGDNDDIDCTWSDGSTGETLTVTESGTYSVTCSNICGTAESSAVITSSNAPSVDLWAFDALVCVNSSIDIAPNWTNLDTPVSWTMNYTDTLGNPQVQVLNGTGESFTFFQSQIPAEAANNNVTVTYSATNFCGTASQSTIVFTDACFIAATNVFTPDSDGSQDGFMAGGVNEGWQIIGIDGISGVQVEVYDRWGSRVYESDSYNNNTPWLGNHKNGDELAAGVYFYVITTPIRDEELTGTVTILRK